MGLLNSLNKLWSGADFWQKDENRQQRESFARQEEEERRKKQQRQLSTSAPSNPTPGTVYQPTQPKVNFDPNTPLQQKTLSQYTGFNTPDRLIENSEKQDNRGFWEKLGDKIEANSPQDMAARESRGEQRKYQGPSFFGQAKNQAVNLARETLKTPERLVTSVDDASSQNQIDKINAVLEGRSDNVDIFNPENKKNPETGLLRNWFGLEKQNYTLDQKDELTQIRDSLQQRKDKVPQYESGIKRLAYGSEPVQSVQDEYRVNIEAAKAGEGIFGMLPESQKQWVKENPENASAIVGGLFTALDIIPGGIGANKAGTKALKSVDDIAPAAARQVDDVAAKFSRPLRKADDVTENSDIAVKKVVQEAADEADSLAGTRRVQPGEAALTRKLDDGIGVQAPAPKIPDPTSPIAISRADDIPMANFDEAIEVPQITRVADDARLELPITSPEPQATLKNANLGSIDEIGNPTLRSDKQVAEELIDQGVPLQRGRSQAAANEDAMQAAARQAEADQVQMTPESQLAKALEDAGASYDEVAEIRKGERGQRIAAGDGAYESAGGGEQGYRAKLAQLKGKYSESGFQPVGVDEGVQVQMLDAVENSGMRGFEKLTAQRGLRKIWGAGEGKPVPSELNLIRKVFGKEGDKIVDQVEQAIKEAPKSWQEKLVDIAGIPRTAMTAFDLSMGLRQGSGVMFTNFPQWARANKESVKYMFNKKYFDDAMGVIKNDDAYTMITDKMGIRLPGAIGDSDELMSSADVLDNIPVYGKGIAGSDRAYTGGLTRLRYDVAKKWVDSLGGVDEIAKLTDDQLKDLGEVVNTFTGSGGKAGGITEKNITTLSSTLFAPRLWASRLNMLNPRFYQRLDPIARKAALKNMSSFIGAATATVGLLEYAGGDEVEVEKDPRSSDFLKVKVGNTRYDIFSGLQQNIVLASRLATGEKKSSTTGEMATLGDGYGAPSRFDVGVDALQNKFNPVLGLASRLMQTGPDDDDNPLTVNDRFGQELNIGTEVAKLGAPLSASGVVESYNDAENVPDEGGVLRNPGKALTSAAGAVLKNIPNFFGIGSQTYGDTPTKDKEAFANQASLKDEKKVLEELGIPTTQEKLSGLAETGNYSDAVRGAKYRLAELEADEGADEGSIARAREDVAEFEFGEQYGYIPSSEDAVTTRAEQGDYEAAIAGWNYRLEKDIAEGNTPESKINKQKEKIRRYEVFQEYSVEPEMVTAYEKRSSDDGGIGVTKWREMMESGDEEVVAYAEKLYNLGEALVEAGAEEENKYYWKEGSIGSRGGSGGSSRKLVTNIGTLSTPGYSFSPQQLKQASFTPAQSQIAELPKLPNYSRENKQISVNRGRRI